MVYIFFYRPGNLDYAFLEVYFSKVKYYIGRVREGSITAGYGMTSNFSGKVIDDIYVKFKLVEGMFNPNISSYGAIIIIIAIMFVAVINISNIY